MKIVKLTAYALSIVSENDTKYLVSENGEASITDDKTCLGFLLL